jgi:hypothetical protein
MRKFEIGEKVEVIGYLPYKGKVGTIEKFHTNSLVYYVLIEGVTYLLFDNELRRQNICKFSCGDFVTIKENVESPFSCLKGEVIKQQVFPNSIENEYKVRIPYDPTGCGHYKEFWFLERELE